MPSLHTHIRLRKQRKERNNHAYVHNRVRVCAALRSLIRVIQLNVRSPPRIYYLYLNNDRACRARERLFFVLEKDKRLHSFFREVKGLLEALKNHRSRVVRSSLRAQFLQIFNDFFLFFMLQVSFRGWIMWSLGRRLAPIEPSGD